MLPAGRSSTTVGMEASLSGKVALVTGASRGIGRAIALTLAESGMSVAITARSADALNEVAAQMKNGFAFPADLAETTAAARFVAAAVERFGRIDLVVNN